MKNQIFKTLLLSFTLFAAAFVACKKDDVPSNNTGNTVKIGNATWTTKNLDVATYANGDPITEVKTAQEWADLGASKTGAWCYYNNAAATGTTYGRLYNWYAVNDPRGLAPTGWHIPTDAEWKDLVTVLGGEENAGGKLKSNDLWSTPNKEASNSSGYSALPGGLRLGQGSFDYLTEEAHFWTATANNSGYSWSNSVFYDQANTTRKVLSNESGCSVRLLKD